MYTISLITPKNIPFETAIFAINTVKKSYTSIDLLATAICDFYWSPILFATDVISSKNFVSTDLLVYDFDDSLSLNDAIKKYSPYKHIIGVTRNHQKPKNNKPPCDKFRVILFLKQEIKDIETYKRVYEASLHDFAAQADSQCSDAARKYAPCREIVSKNLDGELVDADSFKTVSAPLPKAKTTHARLKAAISPATLKFLKNPPDRGMGLWHKNFLKACSDLKNSNYTQDEATQILEEAAKNCKNGTSFLTKEDLYQIDDVFIKRKTRLKDHFSRPLKIWNDQDFIDVCLPFLDHNFVMFKKPDGEKRYFAKNNSTNEVLLLQNSEPIEEALVNFIKQNTAEAGKEEVPNIIFLTKCLYLWRNLATSVISEEPEPFCFSDDNRLTFKKLDFVIKEGSHHTWNQFLVRLSDANCFKAFIWSIFEKKNKSRQILWIQGRGQDGKSKVFEALQSILGVSAAALNGFMLNPNATRFLLSLFYGKRVAFYSDCLNPSFPTNEFVRNVTGGDLVTVDNKFKLLFSTKIYLKVLVASNLSPEITSQVADKSRLIYLKIRPSVVTDDTEFVTKLQNELPHFLYECKKQYYLLCDNHGDIRYNEAVVSDIDDATQSLEEPFECFFDEFLEIVEGARLPRSALWRCMNESRLFKDANNPLLKNNFKVWLDNKKKITILKSNGKNYYLNLRIKGLL